jgi:PAS domain-containing protein
MRFDWRAIFGPALTTAMALIAAFAHHHLSFAANPAPLFVCIVAFASGTLSGLISAVIAVGASALFFFDSSAAPGNDAAELAQLAMLTATTAGTAAITGLLRKRLTDAFAWERKHHALAERLSAALDQVDFGIVLLDPDTRAEFINRAFRDYFALPDEKADSKPPFIALMYHGRDTGAYEMPKDELSAFIAQRTEMMRVGDSTPINIKLRDGKVLRLSCTALPDGGRMLSYTPVTDLVRHTDDPADLEYYLSLRGGGDRGSTRRLRAAE